MDNMSPNNIENKNIDILTSQSINNEQILNCPNCGNKLNNNDNFCTNCGYKNSQTASLQKANFSDFDPIYLNNKEQLLEAFIIRELKKADVNDTKLIPANILKRKQILNIIFSVLVFVYITLIFFHFPLYTYVIGLIILIIFKKITNKYDLIKYLKKEITSRPNEKISNIIMNTKNSFVSDNTKLLRLGIVFIAIITPLLIFMKPRIMYEKVEDGYAVRFYTFGLTNFQTVTIPETYNDKPVVSLRGNTFSNMPFLKKVSLPDSIVEVRGQAFKNDILLTEVNIPSNLEYLGGGAFYNCQSIKNIVLPDTLRYMGGEAFYGASSLESIKLSENLSEIRGNTFEDCVSLTSITIPDNVTRIGGHAFYGDNELREVKFTGNSKLTEIGSSAFRQCYNLYEITLPQNVYINERAFKESPTTIKYYNPWQNINNNLEY